MDLFIEPQQNSYEWQGRSRVVSSRGAPAAPSEPCGGVRAKDACSSYPVPAAWRDEAYSLEQDEDEVELKLMDRVEHNYAEMRFVDFHRDGEYYILAKLDHDRIYFRKNADNTYSEVTFDK